MTPRPTPVYRLMHMSNLSICLQRGALHAPNHVPSDGGGYTAIHNVDIQRQRQITRIPCGPGGVIHDYVPFYFGPRSPMLYQLHTGWVTGYREGQEPIIYLVSTAQAVQQSGAQFVFSDGHGIAAFTKWFDSLEDLEQLDWDAVHAHYWKDDLEHMDRQRKKQAEFLVHRVCDWASIESLAVVNARAQAEVRSILARFGERSRREVVVKPEWYY